MTSFQKEVIRILPGNWIDYLEMQELFPIEDGWDPEFYFLIMCFLIMCF